MRRHYRGIRWTVGSTSNSQPVSVTRAAAESAAKPPEVNGHNCGTGGPIAFTLLPCSLRVLPGP